MKRIVIIGASSGLGRKIALDFARIGWKVGIAARRADRLEDIRSQYPDNIECQTIDVSAPDATERFYALIERLGGMDYMLYSAGTGWQIPDLDEVRTTQTLDANVLGFTRIINAAYLYYKQTTSGHTGHIAAITSVGGVKGMGISAAYSASKRYQWTYLQALRQLAAMQGVNVTITDIRPGFVDTALLEGARRYPMEMTVDYAAPRIEIAILSARRVATVDLRWAVLAGLWSLLPDCLWERLNIK